MGKWYVLKTFLLYIMNSPFDNFLQIFVNGCKGDGTSGKKEYVTTVNANVLKDTHIGADFQICNVFKTMQSRGNFLVALAMGYV